MTLEEYKKDIFDYLWDSLGAFGKGRVQAYIDEITPDVESAYKNDIERYGSPAPESHGWNYMMCFE